MKKIVIVSDSFKESLTANEVGIIIKEAFIKQYPDCLYAIYGMSDGGEGFCETMIEAMHAKKISIMAQDPLGRNIEAYYGLSGEVAIIEMAVASGLDKLQQEEKNPMLTSTYGTGQLIMDAIAKGAKTILLGIGGSATNDGGMGMAQALGVQFYDEHHATLIGQGQSLGRVATIDLSACDERLFDVDFIVACDVDHPLIGPKGASYVFGPQKGATKEMVQTLDEGLKHYGTHIEKQTSATIMSQKGMGAAGGLCTSLYLFSQPTLKPGIELVLDALHIKDDIIDADLVITGEGMINHQTIHGKVPVGVAKIAKTYNKPVIAFTGALGNGYEAVYEYGIDVVVPIVNRITTLEDALKEAKHNLSIASSQVAKTLSLIKK